MRIDVSGATIVNGDGPDRSPLPSTAIPVGARVIAEVTILDTLPLRPHSRRRPCRRRASSSSCLVTAGSPARSGPGCRRREVRDVLSRRFHGRGDDLVRDRTQRAGEGHRRSGQRNVRDGCGRREPGGPARRERQRHRLRSAAGALRVPGRGAGDHADGLDGRGPRGAGGFRDEDRRRTREGRRRRRSRRKSPQPAAGVPRALSISSPSRSSKRIATPPGPGERATEFDGIVESIPPACRRPACRWATGRSPRATFSSTGSRRSMPASSTGTAVHVKGTLAMPSAVVGSLCVDPVRREQSARSKARVFG